ncbi:MAG: Mur ligase family protein, partial [Saprospiraceae bacterium]|nr:Mur ligase family protein [Saprospiraceae bacterium]
MKHLDQILADVTFEWLSKPGSVAINSIEIDSRQVREGSLFIAVKGHRVDGHDFIDSAIKNGAAAILVESVPEILPKADVLIIRVENSRKITGVIAAAFYDHPSSRLTLIGVTGTNGKTSVATMLHQLLGLEGHTAGLISTIENKIGDQVLPSSLTTPDPISLQRLLAEMVHNDCSSAVMEVSSHALDQHRTSGCDFKLAIFTNITHDHLDYHGTFDAYLGAKKS